MNPVALISFQDELEKISARAGLRVIRSLFSKGTPEALQRASRLATTPGVLKPSFLGSQIKHLGRGSEGIADAVAHPDYGVSVRKLYDPTSTIASPTTVGRKIQSAKQIQSPYLAETKGFARTGSGGRISFHEYVPGGAPSAAEEVSIKSHLQSAGAKKGYQLEDIRSANIRGNKAVDVLPFHQGEVADSTRNRIRLTNKAFKSFAPHIRKSYKRSTNGLTDTHLYRLLQGGGTGTPLSRIPTAPARAPIKSSLSPVSSMPIARPIPDGAPTVSIL